MCGCVRERNFAHGPVRCNTRDCSFRGAMNAWLGGSAPARTWTSWCSNALPPCATRSKARWNGSWTTSALTSFTWMNSMPGFVPGRSRNSSMQPIFEEIWFRFGEAEKEAKLLGQALAYFRSRAPAESPPAGLARQRALARTRCHREREADRTVLSSRRAVLTRGESNNDSIALARP